MKKVLTAILFFALIITMLTANFTVTGINVKKLPETESDFQIAANMLIELKVISKSDISSDNITRKEISHFIANIKSAHPEFFIDDDSAIEYCTNNFIIAPDWIADPDEPVTFQEAVKIFVTALGYPGLVPAVNIIKAAEKEVRLLGDKAVFKFKDVKTDKILTKNDVIKLLYNFLMSDYQQMGLTWDSGIEKYITSTKSEPVYKSFGLIITTPTKSKVTVNGKEISFDAYNIDGSIYFKLRDLAYVLNETEKQFEIGWDEKKNSISLTRGEAYTSVGGEMSNKGMNKQIAVITTSTIYIDDEKVNFTAYTIGGNNYFKLREIGQTFDFGVSLDDKNEIIVINTSESYILEDELK